MLLDTSSTQVFYAFLITLWAGLSTGIGSALIFFTKRTNRIFLSVSLGFSAGVMVYVSFVELFRSAETTMAPIYGERLATLYTTLAFFAGVALIGVIDRLIPEAENPHELPDQNAVRSLQKESPINDHSAPAKPVTHGHGHRYRPSYPQLSRGYGHLHVCAD